MDLLPQSINCAAYHDGKVLVWMGNHSWCVVTEEFAANNYDHIDIMGLETTDGGTPKDSRYMRDNNYVFESRGELLWASVLLDHDWFRKCGNNLRTDDSVVTALAVMVHALDEVNGKMRWVERDGRCLDDRVLFLSFRRSFAAEATQLGMDGGCAYFVFHHRLFK